MHSYVGLFRSIARHAEQEHSVAVCTVVGTAGSAPQVAGAMMLVYGDMTTEGTLGGGCVEADVRRQAFELLQRNSSATLAFTLDHDYGWDDSLICGGQMTIAVTPIRGPTEARPFVEAAEALESGRPATVSIRVQQEGRLREYCLHVERPAKLIIAGAGHVGAEVARRAVGLDFDVVVIDDRADLLKPGLLPPPIVTLTGDIAETLTRQAIDANTFVVVVTRGHKHDEAALQAVIGGEARYLGMIGSRRKIKLIYDDLAAKGVDPERLAAVHAPIGLPIGAVTVPEIAVSILAELVQVRRKEKPTHVDGPFDVAETEPRASARAVTPPEKGHNSENPR